MSKPFTHLLRVRYADCDAQAIVFNGKYVEYIDVAATEFIRVVWGGFNALFTRSLDQQVVNVNVAWKSPAVFDDFIAMSVESAHIGNTSYTLKLVFSNYGTGAAIATAEIVYVMISTQEHGKTAIPDDLREALEKGAPDLVVDHAGASED